MNGRWPSLMNLETAGEYLSLSPRTLEEIVDDPSSSLRYVKLPVGGRIVRKRLLARADLDAWIDEGRRLAITLEDGNVEAALQWLSTQ
ncbi:hypothetical protein MYX64_06020 [Nitrospinae bacterium AH_259_B05_G02_I21]|nr:hypothetical protein [Nitrospinae bacterium AH_259_B05_G02_I21]MDA2931793.1 hypothetical protein [Nitrospinae bacterium AH-259-F20]